MTQRNAFHPLSNRILGLLFALVLSLIAATLFWLFKEPTQEIPKGVSPLHVDLNQIIGPWYEVARLDSAPENAIKNPVLFIKYSGLGGDKIYPFADPEDPRFRVIILGNSSSGSSPVIWDEVTDKIEDYKRDTITMPCWGFLKCAFHLIAYDDKNRSWMVFSGHKKTQLWIFSRAPGLTPQLMEDLKDQLADWGFNIRKLIYSHQLPSIPHQLPPIPETLPKAPIIPLSPVDGEEKIHRP